jgi:anti-anti-sigma factor
MNNTFAVSVRNLSQASVLELHGDIDGGAAELTSAYEEAAGAGGTGEILLDFSDVSYINSSGIALIVSVLARARAAGRKVVAAGLSAHYRQIFEITRLSDFIELRDDVEGPSWPAAQVSG